MSTSAGGILVFLLLAIAAPAAILLLARVSTRRRARTDSVAAPAPLPSWVPFSIDSFLTALVLAAVAASVVAVVAWAVTLHLLDKGYALAELLLFVALLGAGGVYGWVQGVVRTRG